MALSCALLLFASCQQPEMAQPVSSGASSGASSGVSRPLQPPVTVASTPAAAEQPATLQADPAPSADKQETETQPAAGPPAPSAQSTVETVAVITAPKPEAGIIKALDPASLIGLTLAEISQQIGNADRVRYMGNIGVWQYLHTHCVIDLFFTGAQNTPLSTARADSFETRSRVWGDALDKDRCHEEFFQRQP